MTASVELLLDGPPPRAVFDADLLAKIWITDLLLKIAENTGWIEPVWTEQILEETYRAQTLKFKRPWSEKAASYFLLELKRSFPAAMISGHEKWIAQCTNTQATDMSSPAR